MSDRQPVGFVAIDEALAKLICQAEEWEETAEGLIGEATLLKSEAARARAAAEAGKKPADATRPGALFDLFPLESRLAEVGPRPTVELRPGFHGAVIVTVAWPARTVGPISFDLSDIEADLEAFKDDLVAAVKREHSC